MIQLATVGWLPWSLVLGQVPGRLQDTRKELQLMGTELVPPVSCVLETVVQVCPTREDIEMFYLDRIAASGFQQHPVHSRCA